jgi:hypothetical protein
MQEQEKADALKALNEFQQWLANEARESFKYDPLRYREDMYIYDKLLELRKKYASE